MATRSHLSISNLSVTYGGHQALRDVSIDIPDACLTAIIGPSGCGKTTLLKAMNRLVELQDGVRVDGRVLLDGEDIYGPGVEVTHLRKKVGLLLQKPQVFPMSIYDNVAFGPRIHGVQGKAKLDDLVEHYLREVTLWEEVESRLTAPAARLSVGQQQRLCLARGLAIEPEILLGDEPTSALDPISAQHIEKRLLDLKEEYTIVLVTHILRQARRMADYVIFMYLGEVVEAGLAHEVFEHPHEERTRAYLEGVF